MDQLILHDPADAPLNASPAVQAEMLRLVNTPVVDGRALPLPGVVRCDNDHDTVYPTNRAARRLAERRAKKAQRGLR